jgi:hypothetical protein
VLAATHDIRVFFIVIAFIAISGWVADQALDDLRTIRRDRRRRRG